MNSEYFKSKFVVIGTVVSEQIEKDTDGSPEASDYVVRVRQTYRGEHHALLTLRSENDSGRFPMVRGQTYLLFIRIDDRHLRVDNCGNSSLRSDAQDAIDGIGEIAKSGNYGEIEGRVVSGGQVGISGVQMLARTGKMIFSALTDGDGWFQMRVPPGTYTLQAKSSDFPIVPYDLNEEDPKHFLVHRGGCVHIEYDASKK